VIIFFGIFLKFFAEMDAKLSELMERLKAKAVQLKSWTETTKTVRMAMSVSPILTGFPFEKNVLFEKDKQLCVFHKAKPLT
jgi:hypothetical protein